MFTHSIFKVLLFPISAFCYNLEHFSFPYENLRFFIFTLFGIQWVSLAQFSSVTQSCLTLCDPMDCTTPGLLVHHQFHSLLKLMSIMSVMPSNHLILCHPLSSCLQSFPASGSSPLSSSLHQMAKVSEFQLQYQFFQWTFRTDFL